MKKFLSAALCAATLAAGLTGVAHADQLTFVTLTPPSDKGDMTATAPVSDSFTDATEFTDWYAYANLPAFSTDEFKVSSSGIAFADVALYTFPFPSTLDDIRDLSGSFGASSFDLTTTDPLPGALWVLQIHGFADADSSYSGTIFSTAIDTPAAVPEPTSALLLLAGLGVVGARATRARKQAVAA